MLWVITELLLSHRSGLRSVINGTKLSEKLVEFTLKWSMKLITAWSWWKFDKVFQKKPFCGCNEPSQTVSQSPSQHSGNFLCGFIIKKIFRKESRRKATARNVIVASSLQIYNFFFNSLMALIAYIYKYRVNITSWTLPLCVIFNFASSFVCSRHSVINRMLCKQRLIKILFLLKDFLVEMSFPS